MAPRGSLRGVSPPVSAPRFATRTSPRHLRRRRTAGTDARDPIARGWRRRDLDAWIVLEQIVVRRVAHVGVVRVDVEVGVAAASARASGGGRDAPTTRAPRRLPPPRRPSAVSARGAPRVPPREPRGIVRGGASFFPGGIRTRDVRVADGVPVVAGERPVVDVEGCGIFARPRAVRVPVRVRVVVFIAGDVVVAFRGVGPRPRPRPRPRRSAARASRPARGPPGGRATGGGVVAPSAARAVGPSRGGGGRGFGGATGGGGRAAGPFWGRRGGLVAVDLPEGTPGVASGCVPRGGMRCRAVRVAARASRHHRAERLGHHLKRLLRGLGLGLVGVERLGELAVPRLVPVAGRAGRKGEDHMRGARCGGEDLGRQTLDVRGGRRHGARESNARGTARPAPRGRPREEMCLVVGGSEGGRDVRSTRQATFQT